MALSLDGFLVLRIIAAHPDAFSDVSADANKAGRMLVTKQLKKLAANVKRMRDYRKLLGREIFGLVIDGLKDSEVKAILGKLDKHRPELKTANADQRRRHLFALADGSADPSEKTKPAAKTSKGKKAGKPTPTFLNSEAMAATRKRWSQRT